MSAALARQGGAYDSAGAHEDEADTPWGFIVSSNLDSDELFTIAHWEWYVMYCSIRCMGTVVSTDIVGLSSSIG